MALLEKPIARSPAGRADAAIIAQSQLKYVGHLLGDPAWFPVVSP
jgi:hypothetical protein